jgi:hypothetical protein
MYKTHDYMHYHQGCSHSGSIRRIEIFEEEKRPPVIICTEPREDDHGSIGGTVACLAARVVREHFPSAFEEIGEPFVWIEHRLPVAELGRPAVYQWVTFDSYAPRQILHAGGIRHVALGRAHRTPIDRAAVDETLGIPYVEASARPARLQSILNRLANALDVALPAKRRTGQVEL